MGSPSLQGGEGIRREVALVNGCLQEVGIGAKADGTKTGLLKALVGDLSGAYSRRINLQHRLVYQVYAKEKTVKVIRMWTHYE